jgi:ABC-type transporter Mla MlaB component
MDPMASTKATEIRVVRGKTTTYDRPYAGVEPKLMDLRLHAPRPDVMIVRVSGPVDEQAACVLADRVRKQLHRAPHVIVDLARVSTLCPSGLTVLSTLFQLATAQQTRLHVVVAEHDELQLRTTSLASLLSRESTPDAVISALSEPVMARVGSGPSSGDEDGGTVYPVGGEVGQCCVGLVERVGGGDHVEGVFCSEAQEVVTVLAGVGCDAADLPFLEQVLLVVQDWDVGEVDAGYGQGAAAVERSERG